jgi:hypothetical protein
LIPLQKLFFQVKSLLGLEIFVNAVIGTLTRNVIFAAMGFGALIVKPVPVDQVKTNVHAKVFVMPV